MGDRSKFFWALGRLYQCRAVNALEFLCEQAPPEPHLITVANVTHLQLWQLVVCAVHRQGTILAMNENGRALFHQFDFQSGLLDVYDLFPKAKADRCVRLVNQALDSRRLYRIQGGGYSQTIVPLGKDVAIVLARPLKPREFVERPEPEEVQVIG